MIQIACKHSGCNLPAPKETGFCSVHSSEYSPRKPFEGLNSNSYESAKHYQTAEWKAFRRAFLATYPTCAICGTTDKVLPDHYSMSANEMIATFGRFLTTIPEDFHHYRTLCHYHNVSEGNKRRANKANDTN